MGGPATGGSVLCQDGSPPFKRSIGSTTGFVGTSFSIATKRIPLKASSIPLAIGASGFQQLLKSQYDALAGPTPRISPHSSSNSTCRNRDSPGTEIPAQHLLTAVGSAECRLAAALAIIEGDD